MRTVKVRIAVAVEPSGHWAAHGWRDETTEEPSEQAMDAAVDFLGESGEARYWVTAEVPVPEPVEIAGTVE